MKKEIFSLITLLFFSLSGINADPGNIPIYYENAGKNDIAPHIYFSNEIPVSGIAKGGTSFDIDPAGSYLYLVLDNYPNNFNYDQVQVKVYKTTNGTNEKYDEKTYNISTSLYYTYITYTFYTAGYYIFDIYDKYGTFVGGASVSINYKNGSSPVTTSSTDTYAKSKVYFSTDVPYYGIAKDIKAFKMKSGGGFIYVIIDNYPVNFNVSYLKMYTYKLVDGNYVKQDQANYDINANNYFTYFKYNMYLSGDYKFVFYDAQDRYVNTGYVTITW